MHKFSAFRAGMRPEDPKDRNHRPFDNGSNLNWRGIFLFVIYISVVLGFFLFSRNGNHGSVDGPAPRPSYDERNRGPAPIPPSERSLQTIIARPRFKVSNESLQLEGPTFDREGHVLFWKSRAGLQYHSGEKIDDYLNDSHFAPKGVQRRDCCDAAGELCRDDRLDGR